MKIDGNVSVTAEIELSDNLTSYIENSELERVVLVPVYGFDSREKSSKVYQFAEHLLLNGNKVAHFVYHRNHEKKIGKANRRIKEIKLKYPEKTLAVYAVDIAKMKVQDVISKWHSDEVYSGIKVDNTLNNDDLLSEKYYELFRWAGNNNLPVYLRLNIKKNILPVQKILRDLPGTNFIFQHMRGLEFFPPCTMKMTNFYIEIDGWDVMKTRNVVDFMNRFSVRRFIFGSTFNNEIVLAHALKTLRTICENEYQFDLVTNANCRRAFNID